MNKNTLSKISVEQLKKIHNFSVRTYNVCLKHDLITLEKILNYYVLHGLFTNLEGCGKKSDLELIQVCDKYLNNKHLIDIKNFLPTTNKEEILFEPYQNFSRIKIQFIERYYQHSIQKLNQRAHNTALLLYEKANNSVSELYLQLKRINFRYSQIPKIGKKTTKELEVFYNHLFDVIRLVAKDDDQNIYFDLFLINIEEFISKDNIILKDWIRSKKTLFKGNNFPLLSFIELLIEDEFILSKRKKYLFKYYLNNIENTKEIKLGDIANKFNISRERARQIALPEKLEIPFWEKIEILLKTLNLARLDSSKYEIDTSRDFILLNSIKVNEVESTHFALKFLLQLFAIILEDFHLINKEKFGLQNSYLIRKELLKLFDLRTTLSEINKLLDQKIETSFTLNLKGFISKYLSKPEYWKEINRIIIVCEKILFEEYGILTDFEGNITIEKNTKKAIYEYIIEIMKARNAPMHIDDIFEELNRKKQGLVKSNESVRSHLLKSKFFINTAWSTYGLKVWEDQGIYIGGSIKDLAEKYLLQFEEPKHIHSISQYVKKYRKTTAYNIFGNLQIDPHNRFKFFGFGFFGLGEKDYPVEKTKFRGIPPNIFRNFKKNYFRNKKSVLPLDYLIKVLTRKSMVQEVQIEYSIYQKMEDGAFFLKDNFLFLH